MMFTGKPNKLLLLLLPILIVAFIISGYLWMHRSKRPKVITLTIDNYSTLVSEISSISTDIIKLPNGAINTSTVNAASVYLTEKSTGATVLSSVNIIKEGYGIALTPSSPLKQNTSYIFHITDDVKDISGVRFKSFVSNFSTGLVSTKELMKVRFEKVDLPVAEGQHSTLTIGPDKKLYALSIDGVIKRFAINNDGTLATPDTLYGLQDQHGQRTKRLAIGLAFDPSSTAEHLVAWVTHSSFMFTQAPDWDGKLTRLSGKNLEKAEDVLINLPRSAKDHLTNSIAFGNDGALYFLQGSSSAMGQPDETWSFREEHLLSATLLRLDVSKLKNLPLDVKTFDGGGKYDPFDKDAPLTIYATGLRNAYDLLFHSNGQIYVPTNGSSPGGNTPPSVNGTKRIDGTPYYGPVVTGLKKVKQNQEDFLYSVVKGGYYGHPNPVRGEYVMNGGNPTNKKDPGEVKEYPVGTLPDKNWRGYVFNFMNNTSPNGLIEYKSNTFGGALKGKILMVRYSRHDDIITLVPGNGKIVSSIEGSSIKGFDGFKDPLDLIEDVTTGNIYVSEYGGNGKIVLLRPLDK